MRATDGGKCTWRKGGEVEEDENKSKNGITRQKKSKDPARMIDYQASKDTGMEEQGGKIDGGETEGGQNEKNNEISLQMEKEAGGAESLDQKSH